MPYIFIAQLFCDENLLLKKTLKPQMVRVKQNVLCLSWMTIKKKSVHKKEEAKSFWRFIVSLLLCKRF